MAEQTKAMLRSLLKIQMDKLEDLREMRAEADAMIREEQDILLKLREVLNATEKGDMALAAKIFMTLPGAMEAKAMVEKKFSIAAGSVTFSMPPGNPLDN